MHSPKHIFSASANPDSSHAKLTLEWEKDGYSYTQTGYVKDPIIKQLTDREDLYTDTFGVNRQYYLEFDKDESGKYAHLVKKNMVPERKFSEIRKVQVIVPSLTSANIALAASQAGYDESAAFEVEPHLSEFILTFREANLVGDNNDN